jgi:tetratricopeptide (TPR) repeat protein
MHGPKDPDEHRADLPQLACTVYELISVLIKYGELCDPIWRDRCHAALVRRDSEYEKSIRLQPLREKDVPGRGHWARILKIDPGINDTAGKYLYDPSKYVEGKPLRKTFKGLSFNQVNRASQVLVAEFGLAAEVDPPSLGEDESTWDRVFKRAIAQLTEEIGRRSPNALDRSNNYWLPASNVEIRIPACFMARDAELAEIDAALNQHPNRVSIVALHGLRGVGKTILAATYSHEHRGDYRATWWLSADSQASIHTALVSLGRRLRWVLPDQSDDIALPTVMEALANTAENILLIFDNAIEPAAILPFVPKAGHCKLLITSTWDAWRRDAQQIEIEPWPVSTGAEFLLARTQPATRTYDRSDGEALSGDLGGLPLALEQAAAYCEGEGVSFAQYRKRFAEKKLELLDDRHHAPPQYGLTVAATFGLAIDAAKKRHEAAELFIIYAALLANEPVPLFLFAESQELFPEPLNSALSHVELDRIVASLRAFALVNREPVTDSIEPSNPVDAIRLHTLVRDIAASRVSGEALAQARRYVFVAIARTFPGDGDHNPKSWPRCHTLRPHVLHLWASDPHTFGNAEDWAFLLGQIGAYYRGRGAFEAAEIVSRYALDLLESVFEKTHPSVLAAYNNLAIMLRAKGDFNGAYELLNRVRELGEPQWGPDHPNLQQTLHSLGDVLRFQGKLDQALLLLKQAWGIADKVYGPNHPNTVSCALSTAGVLKELNDHLTALKIYQQCLHILEDAEGPNSAGVAVCLCDIAHLLQMHGETAEALKLLERSLGIAERLYGPAHPQLVAHLSNLGASYIGLGRFSDARNALNRALLISDEFNGREHLQTAQLNRNLAVLLWHQRDARWRPLWLWAIMIFEKQLGKDHPEVKESWRERRLYTAYWYLRKSKLPAFAIGAFAAVSWLVWYYRP